MTPEKVIESTRVEGLRVALYRQEDKSPLSDEGDWLPPIVCVMPADGEFFAGEQYAGKVSARDFAHSVRRSKNIGEAPADLQRRLHQHHGFGQTEHLGQWWALATPEWVATLTPGLSEVEIQAELLRCAEYALDWDHGRIYGWRIEREVVYTSDPDRLGDVQQMTEWEEQDSCWGYVGMAWAEQNAREQLADEELREPIVLPQGRPSVQQDRAAMLWKAVVEPALIAPEPFFHVGIGDTTGDAGWGINLRLGWGEDVTAEHRFDEHTAWMALIAIAAGAMRVEPELALECRALVMGWTEKALSKAAAEAVVQVALVGEAPYPAVH